jgi:hypothetical protein
MKLLYEWYKVRHANSFYVEFRVSVELVWNFCGFLETFLSRFAWNFCMNEIRWKMPIFFVEFHVSVELVWNFCGFLEKFLCYLCETFVWMKEGEGCQLVWNAWCGIPQEFEILLTFPQNFESKVCSPVDKGSSTFVVLSSVFGWVLAIIVLLKHV